jgi:predicted GNAT family acetyltransferase
VEAPSIRHDDDHHRFSTTVDGHEAVLEYERKGGVLAITHTVVPAEIGGRGIAGHLMEAALGHARGEHLKVLPRCSYAAAYLARHPEHASLVSP